MLQLNNSGEHKDEDGYPILQSCYQSVSTPLEADKLNDLLHKGWMAGNGYDELHK